MLIILVAAILVGLALATPMMLMPVQHPDSISRWIGRATVVALAFCSFVVALFLLAWITAQFAYSVRLTTDRTSTADMPAVVHNPPTEEERLWKSEIINELVKRYIFPAAILPWVQSKSETVRALADGFWPDSSRGVRGRLLLWIPAFISGFTTAFAGSIMTYRDRRPRRAVYSP